MIKHFKTYLNESLEDDIKVGEHFTYIGKKYYRRRIGQIVKVVYISKECSFQYYIEFVEDGWLGWAEKDDLLDNIKGMKKIENAEIDPYNEEDWGWEMKESVTSNYELAIRVLDEGEYTELMKKLEEEGYMWNGGGSPKPTSMSYSINREVIYLTYDMKLLHGFKSGYDKFYKEHLPLVSCEEYLTRLYRKKIERPDIDPYGEENWGWEITENVDNSDTFTFDFLSSQFPKKNDEYEDFENHLKKILIGRKVDFPYVGATHRNDRKKALIKNIKIANDSRITIIDDNDNSYLGRYIGGNYKVYILPDDYKIVKDKKIERPDIDPYGEEDWGWENENLNEDIEIGKKYKYIKRGSDYWPGYRGRYGKITNLLRRGPGKNASMPNIVKDVYKMRFDNGDEIYVNYSDLELEPKEEINNIEWWSKLEKFSFFKKKKEEEIGRKFIDINDKYYLLNKDMNKLEEYLKRSLHNKEVTFSCILNDEKEEITRIIKNVFINRDNNELIFLDDKEQYSVVTTEFISYKDVIHRKISNNDPYGEEEWDTNESISLNWNKKKWIYIQINNKEEYDELIKYFNMENYSWAGGDHLYNYAPGWVNINDFRHSYLCISYRSDSTKKLYQSTDNNPNNEVVDFVSVSEFYKLKNIEEFIMNLRKEKELNKLKMMDVDPYGEEEWENESKINESIFDEPNFNVGDIVEVADDFTLYKKGDIFRIESYVERRDLKYPEVFYSIVKGEEAGWYPYHFKLASPEKKKEFLMTEEEKELRREKMKDKMKDVDPYGEEEWENE